VSSQRTLELLARLFQAAGAPIGPRQVDAGMHELRRRRHRCLEIRNGRQHLILRQLRGTQKAQTVDLAGSPPLNRLERVFGARGTTGT
jgi:hypothetical protein